MGADAGAGRPTLAGMPTTGSHLDIRLDRTTAASPAEVMGKVLDPHTWPLWQPEIDSASGPAPLAPGDVVRGHAHLLGFHVQGLSTAIGVEDHAFEEDVIVGVRLRVRYEVARAGDQTVVTRRVRSELPGGLSGRVLSFFLARRLKRMQRNVVEGLVAEAERGR